MGEGESEGGREGRKDGSDLIKQAVIDNKQ